MRESIPILVLGVVLAVSTLLFALACDTQSGSQPSAYEPTATIKDLMDSIVDPSADVIWESVSQTVDSSGTVDRMPRTDEEWAEVRRAAIRLAEGANLLLIPGRHVARPHEKSEAPGIELEPEEIEALINNDKLTWTRHTKDFHKLSVEILQAIDARDPHKLFELGGPLDKTCENCHVQYWYPNQVLPTAYNHDPR